MAVRLTCIDNAQGHDGLRWRMGEDSESIDIVVGETPPGVGELIVSETFRPEACFSVCAFSGNDESDAAEVCAEIGEADLSGAEIGEEVAGGIYTGVITYQDERAFHIITARESSPPASWEVTGVVWGLDDLDDGKANTQLAITQGAPSGSIFDLAVNYVAPTGEDDWYLPATNEALLMLANLVTPGHPDFQFSSN